MDSTGRTFVDCLFETLGGPALDRSELQESRLPIPVRASDQASTIKDQQPWRRKEYPKGRERSSKEGPYWGGGGKEI